MKTYFRLLSYAQPIQRYAIGYLICTVLFVVFNTLNLTLVIPLLQTLFSPNIGQILIAEKPVFGWNMKYPQDIFNYYFNNASVEYGKFGALKFVCGVILCSAFLSNLFKYFSARIMEGLRIQTIQNLRTSVFNNVMDLNVGYFNNQRKGDIMAKISSDVYVVQFTVTSTLQTLLSEPLQLFAYFYVLFTLSSKLTFFAILVIPVAGLAIAAIVKRLRAQAREMQERNGTMISLLDESLSSVKVIKGFNATEMIKQRFMKENVELSELNRAMVRRQQLAAPVSEFFGITTVACLMLFGGYMVLNGQSELSPEQFIAYIAMFSQVTRPAKAISGSFTNIHQGLASGERVLEVIDTPIAVTDKPGAKPAPAFSKAIEFKDVSFAYGEKTIINKINFTIPEGQTVALVGPSGGGKSTICDLIPRFYDVNSGEIRMDGTDIKDLQVDTIRRQIGIVPQESVLFNTSIFNNISFGKPDATMDEVIDAAKIANAHQFISAMDAGYHTNVGDRGTKLSGGQRQRICIARAVLGNPPIMLLDEATSALDTESEKLVQDALNNLMKNRTTMVIAHRLSTIKNADKIVVIEDGRVVEQGSHEELMLKNGVYNKLVGMQAFSAEE